MSNFKVGEVLIGQNFTLSTYRNGAECVVIRGAELRSHFCLDTQTSMPPELMYKVKWCNGDVRAVRPHNLRRKQSPAGEQSILNMFKVSPPKRIKEPA